MNIRRGRTIGATLLAVASLVAASQCPGAPSPDASASHHQGISNRIEPDIGAFESRRMELASHYKLSTDVLYGEVISRQHISSNVGRCNVDFSVVRVVESFKGHHRAGDTVRIVGVDAQDDPGVGTRHLLFLEPFRADENPGFGKCENAHYRRYLAVPFWCCLVVDKPWLALVAYDMLNSETAGPRYRVPAELIFDRLRRLRKEWLEGSLQ